jgi:hypothetical protein
LKKEVPQGEGKERGAKLEESLQTDGVNEENIQSKEEPVVTPQKSYCGFKMTAEEIKDSRPYFIKEKYRRDAEMRKPNEPEFDESTLYVPEKEWKNFTPAMK